MVPDSTTCSDYRFFPPPPCCRYDELLCIRQCSKEDHALNDHHSDCRRGNIRFSP